MPPRATLPPLLVSASLVGHSRPCLALLNANHDAICIPFSLPQHRNLDAFLAEQPPRLDHQTARTAVCNRTSNTIGDISNRAAITPSTSAWRSFPQGPCVDMVSLYFHSVKICLKKRWTTQMTFLSMAYSHWSNCTKNDTHSTRCVQAKSAS